jgi:hypothetical protein
MHSVSPFEYYEPIPSMWAVKLTSETFSRVIDYFRNDSITWTIEIRWNTLIIHSEKFPEFELMVSYGQYLVCNNGDYSAIYDYEFENKYQRLAACQIEQKRRSDNTEYQKWIQKFSDLKKLPAENLKLHDVLEAIVNIQMLRPD